MDRTNMMQTFEFTMTTKEIRKIGYNLGYGAVKGAISAYITFFAILGAARAVKNYIDKHSKITEPETEETTEE